MGTPPSVLKIQPKGPKWLESDFKLSRLIAFSPKAVKLISLCTIFNSVFLLVGKNVGEFV